MMSVSTLYLFSFSSHMQKTKHVFSSCASVLRKTGIGIVQTMMSVSTLYLFPFSSYIQKKTNMFSVRAQVFFRKKPTLLFQYDWIVSLAHSQNLLMVKELFSQKAGELFTTIFNNVCPVGSPWVWGLTWWTDTSLVFCPQVGHPLCDPTSAPTVGLAAHY